MKLVFVLLAFAFSFVNSAKILAVFPVASKSHYAIGEATMRALNEAGHEVTMISVFAPKKPIKNYRQIKIDDVMETMAKGELIYDSAPERVTAMFSDFYCKSFDYV